MKLGKGSLFITLLFCVGLIFASDGFAAEANSLAQKNLKRWPDPVLMKAGIAKETLGKSIANLRLYAFRDGAFKPIRYQIDELTGENGDWVFTEGALPNSELGNNRLDPWDILMFMADDTGDKASKDVWTQGYTAGDEITIVDPLTGEKGWCYLLYFASNPPSRSSLPDYVHSEPTENAMSSDYMRIKSIITDDGLLTANYEYWKITEAAGGNEKNTVDRLKIRTTISFFFGKVNLRLNEENFKSNRMTYKSGPIRILGRYEMYIKWRNKKLARNIVDVMLYRNITINPNHFEVPIKLSTVVSSFVIRLATDLSPDMIGSKSCVASNPNHWYQIDGKMDADEKNFNPPGPIDKWRITTGDCGTVMFCSILPQKMLDNSKIIRGIIDDTNQPDPPERYPGCVGMAYQDWYMENIPKGTYFYFVNWYIPIKYKPGDEVMYDNMTDHPLQIRVGNKDEKNYLLAEVVFGKKYM